MEELKCGACGTSNMDETVVSGCSGQICSKCIYSALGLLFAPGLESGSTLESTDPKKEQCSFCAGYRSEVSGMLGHGKLRICLECLASCAQTVAEVRLHQAGVSGVLAMPQQPRA